MSSEVGGFRDYRIIYTLIWTRWYSVAGSAPPYQIGFGSMLLLKRENFFSHFANTTQIAQDLDYRYRTTTSSRYARKAAGANLIFPILVARSRCTPPFGRTYTVSSVMS